MNESGTTLVSSVGDIFGLDHSVVQRAKILTSNKSFFKQTNFFLTNSCWGLCSNKHFGKKKEGGKVF
jgi:hypothetical protein